VVGDDTREVTEDDTAIAYGDLDVEGDKILFNTDSIDSGEYGDLTITADGDSTYTLTTHVWTL
jgi:VCBS repeat-containing protein